MRLLITGLAGNCFEARFLLPAIRPLAHSSGFLDSLGFAYFTKEKSDALYNLSGPWFWALSKHSHDDMPVLGTVKPAGKVRVLAAPLNRSKKGSAEVVGWWALP